MRDTIETTLNEDGIYRANRNSKNVATYAQSELDWRERNPQGALGVLKDGDYGTASLDGLKGVNFGRSYEKEKATLNKALAQMEETIDTQKYTTYDTYSQLADALYNKEVDAIVVGTQYKSMLELNHEGFDEETRIVKTYEFDKKAKISNEIYKNLKKNQKIYKSCKKFKLPKYSIKNGFASASSFEVSAHSFEKCNARSFISFQLNAILFSVSYCFFRLFVI